MTNSPPGVVIRSAQNPTIAYARSLHRRDHRQSARAFVVEGRVAVLDAVAAGAMPTMILMREGEAPLQAVLPPTLPVRIIDPKLYPTLSDLDTPPGILAVFPFPDLPVPAPSAVSGEQAPLYLVLDELRDPGNLGTLLRTAAAAGVSAVYLTPGSVDPFNPKVVRASMGAHFRLPILPLDTATTAALVAASPLRVVATGDASAAYDTVDWRQPATVIIGAEAAGVGPAGRALGTVAVAIPLAASVESLNAAVAGAVILFEAARQRRAGGPPTAISAS